MKIILFLTFVLVACAAEQKKSEWQVSVSKEGEKKVWVWKNDGSKQCDAPSKFTPEAAAKSLKQSGVMVYQFKNGSDGLMRATVCGEGTGTTVELEISRNDLVKALQLGFQSKQE